MIQIVRQDITLPLYGNKHIFPYGQISLVDDQNPAQAAKWVRIKYDGIYPYVTFNRKRIYLENVNRFSFKIKEDQQ